MGEDWWKTKNLKDLREIFRSFGAVDDVVIKSFKKKGSALVVMASREAAVSLFLSSEKKGSALVSQGALFWLFAASGNVLGELSNPLLVLPLQPTSSSAILSADRITVSGFLARNKMF
ncbi:unnamed protein product [Fraxinus pennsylvanica]|uniref:RRM domain-containing protein n=1 Tax=Fraxinus pennsylvanica TaxID=56036 RepID=A0AAD2DRD6_9LAMI|nr:unnamed protein product [Fraxinus pennsylvanica]